MMRFVLVCFLVGLAASCLITNCPRGGKRSSLNIRPCTSCGPGLTGQCFGPSICCGPFGCLIGTMESKKCQRDGLFSEREPCIAGTAFCRKGTGRCAIDGVCCTQESCHVDKACLMEEDKGDFIGDFYN